MKDKKMIPMIAGAAAAVVLIIVAIVTLANPGKAAVSKYYKAYDKAEDGEMLYKLTPQIELDYINDNIEDKKDKKEEDDFIKDLDKRIDDVVDEREKDYERKFKIVKTRKVDKEVIEDYNEWLDKKSAYQDVYNAKEHEVTKAYILEVRSEVVQDEQYGYNYTEFVAIKENGKWKLADMLSEGYGFDWENGLEDDKDKD